MFGIPSLLSPVNICSFKNKSGLSQVINLFRRDGKLEAYNLDNGNAYCLNIGYTHAVVNMSRKPRIALMFTLDGSVDLEDI